MMPLNVLWFAFMALYVVPPPPVPLEISKQTTYFTAPLNADGTVNYVQALDDLYRNGVKPEDNAAVLLIQAFGPADIERDRLPATLKGLGLKPDALPEKGDYLDIAAVSEHIRAHPLPTAAQILGPATQPAPDSTEELLDQLVNAGQDLEKTHGCGIATRNQCLAGLHSLARFIGLRNPE